jgi:inosine-uridine nucleoside N-ribohydrolase
LAVTVTKDNTYAAPMVDLVNSFYGRGDIPIGVVQQGVTPQDGKYLKPVVEAVNEQGNARYRRDVQPGANMPDAVTLLRDTLAAEDDGSVVVIQVGFSTNLARLLQSEPDAISNLNGQDLVKRKVKLLSIMAAEFHPKYENHKEYNIVKDLDASRYLFEHWPTPMVVSGYEIGRFIQYPAESMQEDYNYVEHHPVKEAYHYYRGLTNDQPTYDLTSVLYAVRPDRGYFGLSPRGTVHIDENGLASFEENSSGQHRYLTVTPEQVAAVREALCAFSSEPPKKQ